MAEKKKISKTDLQYILASMAQMLANTAGTQQGSQLAVKAAENRAADEYREEVEDQEKKAKKGGFLGSVGRIAGTVGASMIPAVGPVLAPFVAAAGGEAGNAAGHLLAGEKIDPTAVLGNTLLGGVTGTLAGKLGAAGTTQKAAAGAAQPLETPKVEMPSPDGLEAPKAEYGTPPDTKLNVNMQGLEASLQPQAAQAQPTFMERLASETAKAILANPLPKMDVVRPPSSPRAGMALSPEVASTIRNEGTEQAYRKAQLENQQAQTQATVANTQLQRDRFGYEQQRDVAKDAQWDKKYQLDERGVGLQETQLQQTKEFQDQSLINDATQIKNAYDLGTERIKVDREQIAATLKGAQIQAGATARNSSIAEEQLQLDKQRNMQPDVKFGPDGSMYAVFPVEQAGQIPKTEKLVSAGVANDPDIDAVAKMAATVTREDAQGNLVQQHDGDIYLKIKIYAQEAFTANPKLTPAQAGQMALQRLRQERGQGQSQGTSKIKDLNLTYDENLELLNPK